jgi:hypothetical protein
VVRERDDVLTGRELEERGESGMTAIDGDVRADEKVERAESRRRP